MCLFQLFEIMLHKLYDFFFFKLDQVHQARSIASLILIDKRPHSFSHHSDVPAYTISIHRQESILLPAEIVRLCRRIGRVRTYTRSERTSKSRYR